MLIFALNGNVSGQVGRIIPSQVQAPHGRMRREEKQRNLPRIEILPIRNFRERRCFCATLFLACRNDVTPGTPTLGNGFAPVRVGSKGFHRSHQKQGDSEQNSSGVHSRTHVAALRSNRHELICLLQRSR